MSDLVMRPPQLAKLLGLHPKTVQQRCRDGVYTHVEKDGKGWIINVTKEHPYLYVVRED